MGRADDGSGEHLRGFLVREGRGEREWDTSMGVEWSG